MIPDKIFVCIPQRLNMPTFKEDSKYVGMAYTDRGNLKSRQIEEYISKDALMKWAKEKREWYEGTDFADVYQKVIDKLNSL